MDQLGEQIVHEVYENSLIGGTQKELKRYHSKEKENSRTNKRTHGEITAFGSKHASWQQESEKNSYSPNSFRSPSTPKKPRNFDLNILPADDEESNSEASEIPYSYENAPNQGVRLEKAENGITINQGSQLSPGYSTERLSFNQEESSTPENENRNGRLRSTVQGKEELLAGCVMANPLYDELVKKAENFVLKLSAKRRYAKRTLPPTGERQHPWKFLRELREEKGLIKPFAKYPSIREFRSFRDSYSKFASVTGRARTDLLIFFNIIAGNSLFRKLHLEDAESEFLFALHEKWHQHTAASADVTWKASPPCFKLILQCIDFLNKTLLLKISYLNHIFHPALFDDEGLIEAQTKAFEFMKNFWSRDGILQALLRVPHLISDDAEELTEFPYNVLAPYSGYIQRIDTLCSISWSMFQRWVDVNLSPKTTALLKFKEGFHPNMKSSLNYILIQEALYYTGYRKAFDVFKRDFKIETA
ncbi:hypothetical protein O181_003008 [Austropuccinia psidii MF-1]|uniref:Uncharacterized protein n=1 Tax=Austropuccinia psidii MF-1 TaxID=1389203 RepID=A0A9Q3BDL2_9BASI|nr:hypothetical protein [Austropuccinia psidii MF-1]